MKEEQVAVETTTVSSASPEQKSKRIAAIDWMRGWVMVLMLIDHASMAFDGTHGRVAMDTARIAGAGTTMLPAFAFFTRWIAHICAPTFVLLAGTSLALSVERRVSKGVSSWTIDQGILIRGAIIVLLDVTVISFGSGHWNIGVLMAIGGSMMAMAFLRRLPTWALLILVLGWMGLGEFVTDWVWDTPGNSSPLAAIFMANYASPTLLIHYPIIPWLALMMLGWVFGRHIVLFQAGKTNRSPIQILMIAGTLALVIFAIVRYAQGYGDMFLHRADGSWQQWLHVSKYPPSLTYYALELGLLAFSLALMMKIEPKIGVRPNGPLLVFGQTAMFFYLVHRLVLEIPATYFGLRGIGDISATYIVTALMLVPLYFACRWYRGFKTAHPTSLLRYF